MGISKGADALYHLHGLTMTDVAAGVRGLYADRLAAGDKLNMDMATIDGDANNILKVVGGKSTTKSAAVAEYFLKWKDTGIKVHPVVDGRTRPNAKKATCDRRATRHREYIQSYVLLKEVNTLKRELASGTFTADDIIEKNKIIQKKQEQSSKKLSRSQQSWPPDFPEALEEELVNGAGIRSPDSSGGYIGAVMEATYEADYAIIGRFLNKEIIAAISADSDIAVMAGDNLPCIKKFTEAKGNAGREGMTIVCTSKATLLGVMKHIPDQSKAELVDAECPIFEGVKSRKLRALMMIACGCDVYPSGIKGVGPKTLKKKYLDKIDENLSEGDKDDDAKKYNELFKMVVKNSKLDDNVIDTFVKALLYQPTNYKSCEALSTSVDTATDSPLEPYTYMDGSPPVTLPSYIFSDFAQSGVTTIDDGGPEVSTCLGAEDHSHKFLSATGFKKCHGCNGIACGKCTQKIIDKHFCLSCAAGELLVPRRDDSQMERIEFMRHQLKHSYQWDRADELAVDEVEEAYSAAIKPFTERMKQINEVKFPLHPTSTLKETTLWKKISTLYFNNGGTFISESSLRSHVPELLHLFSSFVKYEGPESSRGVWMKEEGVYDALPSMIINFAENSRVQSGEATGFRLLERCVRHGHDPRMPSLFYSKADIIELEDGSIGLVITSKVPASMRGVIYSTTTAHTANQLLAAECDCKSGSKEEEKIVCVHNSTIPYGVTKLMYEGLAEHILIELTSCIALLFEKWSEDTKSSARASIILLMEAAGVSVNEYEKQVMTIDALLDRFVTGTEKEKTWGQGVSKFVCCPKPGPIREMCFDSPAKKAKHLKNINKKEEADEITDSGDQAHSFTNELIEHDEDGSDTPNYFHATSLIKAAGINLSSFDPVGMKLLQLRADSVDISHDAVIETYQNMIHCWEQLQSEAKVRSRRISEASITNLRRKRPPVDRDELTRPNNLDSIFAANHEPKAKKRRVQPSRGPIKPPEQQPKKRGRPKIHAVKPPPNRIKVNAHTYCSMNGCPVNNVTHPTTSFHRIPAIPAELPLDASKAKHIKRAGRLLNREEIMDRAGFKRSLNEGSTYRICDEHQFESVTKSKSFIYVYYTGSELAPNDDDWVVIERCSNSYTLQVPKAEGASSTVNLPTTKNSTGIATDRMKRRQLEVLNKQMKNGQEVGADSFTATADSSTASTHRLIADAAESRMAVQLIAEMNSPSRGKRSKSRVLSVNPSVAREAGLQAESAKCPAIKTPYGEKFFYAELVTPQTSNAKKKVLTESVDPVVTLGMGNDEVQHRTGFRSEALLLAYIFLISEGDVDMIRRRNTPLTWYEEWFFFAEMIYGRSITSWWNAKDKYGPDQRYMRCVFRQKLALVKRARQRWGYFVSYEEDVKLRKEKWNIKYREREGVKTRVIMWDMTGIEAYRFGAAELQRNTFSKYYAGNCFKGGIGIQLCSWGVTWTLWGGHESDSGYHASAGYLQAQAGFQKKDLIDDKIVPFTNVLDKGYRARAVNYNHGEQLTAQPVFGKSDQHFKGSETKYSASLASDRGANERGVNVSKRSGLIKRGFKPGMDAAMFDDVWLSWGFMANFMYKQLL